MATRVDAAASPPASVFFVCLLLVVSGIVGCAGPYGPAARSAVIDSEQAFALWRAGNAVLIDTRHPDERSGRAIAGATAVSFGGLPWSPAVDAETGEHFLRALAAAGIGQHDTVITICNWGVRAKSAAAFLQSRGFVRAHAVSGGYFGDSTDPGWQFTQ